MGGERREGSVQEPGLAGECEPQLLAGHMCPAPLHTPCRRVGRQPTPFPGLLPALCQHSSKGQGCSGAGSQPACRQEAACPPTCPLRKPAPTLSSAQLPSYCLCYIASFCLRILLCTRPLPTSQPPFSHPFCTPTSKHVFPRTLLLHLYHFYTLVPFATLHPYLTILAHTQPH